MLKGLKFTLPEWDIRTIMSIIDKNQDGVIEYNEFLDIGRFNNISKSNMI